MAKLTSTTIYGTANVTGNTIITGNTFISALNGVAIGSGNTGVTQIVRSAAGSNYTSAPTLTFSAPTTFGGVTATANAIMSVSGSPITTVNAGSGYTTGDILTFVGGVGSAAAVTVTANGTGGVTGVTLTTSGAYSTVPTSPVSVTGGTGSSATFTLVYNLNATQSGIINPGSGYVDTPTITFSGGGGTSAAAYAIVGFQTSIKSIGKTGSASSLGLYTPSGLVLNLADSSAPAVNYWQMYGSNAGNGITSYASGSDSNINMFYIAKGTGSINFATGGTSGSVGFRVIDPGVVSVNYLQVNGTASAGVVTMAAAGADASIPLSIQPKTTGYVSVGNQQANYFQFYSAGAGGSPTFWTWGSDGSVPLTIATKGNGNVTFKANNGGNNSFVVSNSSNGVNYLQTNAGLAGNGPTLSAQGLDANIPLVLQPKGTGAIQAQQTDSTATGGNARGANAVDFQTARGVAASVASASNSVIIGGFGNAVTNLYGAIVCGQNQSVAGYQSFIGNGNANVIGSNGQWSSIVGGNGNNVYNYFGFIGGGYGNFTNQINPLTNITTTNITSTGILNVMGLNAAVRKGTYLGVGGSAYWALGGIATGNTFSLGTGASISGTTLTVGTGSGVGTANIVGYVVSGGTTIANTFITNPISGSGDGSTWAVNFTQTSTPTFANNYTLAISGAQASSANTTYAVLQTVGTVVSGTRNAANGIFSFIGNGGDGTSANNNVASGDWSSVVNGYSNQATGTNSVVVNGAKNVANGAFSFVGGGGGSAGDGNYAAAANSAVVGGQTNIIDAGAQWGFIGGGKVNSLGASAQYGVVAGGVNNSASQYLGCILGGTSNLNYGQYASLVGGFNNQVGFMGFVGGGQYNNASTTNQFGAVVGGYQNNAYGNHTFVGGGYRNYASGIYSAILGGYQSTTRSINCAQAFGNSPWGSTQGTSQLGTYILSANTNSSTDNTMTTDWTYPASATNQVTLPTNSAYIFRGSVVGTITGGGNTSMWTFQGGIKQGATTGSTALVGSPTVSLVAQDGGASSWSVAVTANTTLGSLQISVVGDPSATVRWVGCVDTTEVTF